MDDFLVNISSFPTVIYTTSLVVVVGYWLLAFTGTFDLDAFEVGVEIDIEAGVDGDVSDIGRVAGLLTTLGLTGVPITIVISLLLLNAWIICYFVSLLIPTLPQSISLVQIAHKYWRSYWQFYGFYSDHCNNDKTTQGVISKNKSGTKIEVFTGIELPN